MLNAKINELAEQFESSLLELVAGTRIACLADFPNHANVGDSAIYLGEIEALNRIGVDGSFDVYDFVDHDFAANGHVPEGSIILIHGGGNFGDLYPRHQKLRIDLLKCNVKSRIIQLPQSIHFEHGGNVEETAAAIGAHPDFHLMVRDRHSEAFAREHFKCNVVLSPDAALSLRELKRTAAPTIERLGLIRTDKETTNNALRHGGGPGLTIEDWLAESASLPKSLDERMKRLGVRYPRVLRQEPLRSLRRHLYWHIAKARVDRGVSQLSRAKFIVTDRLHGHILSCLLGIEHECLDNNYGKIRLFRECWGL